METLGERVRYYRELRGLSLRCLAAKAKLSVGIVHKVEIGTRGDLRISTLRKLAAALEVPVSVLLGDEEMPEASAVGRGALLLNQAAAALEGELGETDAAGAVREMAAILSQTPELWAGWLARRDTRGAAPALGSLPVAEARIGVALPPAR